MNELPLNAVENTRGEASKNLDSHSNFGNITFFFPSFSMILRKILSNLMNLIILFGILSVRCSQISGKVFSERKTCYWWPEAID